MECFVQSAFSIENASTAYMFSIIFKALEYANLQ